MIKSRESYLLIRLLLMNGGGVPGGSSAAEGVLSRHDWLKAPAARARYASDRQGLIIFCHDLIIIVHIDNRRDTLDIVIIFVIVNNFVAIEGVVDVLVLILVGH